MSAKATAWAWKATLPKAAGVTPCAARVVLVKLADQANDEGYSWPAWKTLAAECSVTRSTVGKVLAYLEETGLVTRVERRRENGSKRSSYYVLHLFGPPSPELLEELHSPSDGLPPSARRTTPVRKTDDLNRQEEQRGANAPRAGEDSAPPEETETLYSTLLEVCGIERSTLAKGEARRVALAAGELPKEATPELVRKAARAWPTLFRDATITPQAIAKNFGRLLAGAKPTRAEPGSADRKRRALAWATGRALEVFATEDDFRGILLDRYRDLSQPELEEILEAYRNGKKAA